MDQLSSRHIVHGGGSDMAHRGPEFYDDPSVFTTYMQHREWSQNPNETIDRPILMELVGDVKDRTILDLGCGNAGFGVEAIQRGCRRYAGIDGSKNMTEAGRAMLQGTAGEIILSSIEDWDYPECQFDLVVSRLALHYIDDIEACFRKVHRTLTSG